MTSPLLLIAVAASLGACFILSLKNEKRMIAGREVQLAHQYAVVAVFTIPLLYIAGAGSAMFWVLGKLFLSVYYSNNI